MKFYLFSIACLFTLFSYTQNTLNGKVISKQSGEPVSAHIYIPKLEKGTIADFDGLYALKNIPNGTYTVVYSAIGYSSVSLKLNFENHQETWQEVSLIETAVEMEEVIISTPFHRLQSENVMKIDRVSVEKMRLSGVPTLAEGINSVPGVNLISTGTGIGKPVIRGLSSNRVLTYVQGIRMENQQFGEEHGLGINDSGIESVEVIKGPASLLYGSDALGGVLYFNPEKFGTSEKIETNWNSSYFSNTLGFSTDIGVKKSWENFKFLIRAGMDSHSDYKTGDNYRIPNSRFNEKDLKSGLQYKNNYLKSTFRYNYNQANLGIPEELNEQTTIKTPTLPFQEVSTHILSLANKIFLNHSHIDVTLGYLINDRQEFEEDAHIADLDMKLSTFNYDLKYHLPQKSRFQTIIGVQGLSQKNKNYGAEVLIPDAHTNDIGMLATTHYHLERMDFQAGLRFDNRNIKAEAMNNDDSSGNFTAFDNSYNSFTAAFGVKADLFKNLILRLNLANGFRAPNLAELSSNGIHEGTYRYERGNVHLKNEKNIQFDASLELRTSHFEVALNTFYNTVSNFIFLAPTQEFIDEHRVYDYLQEDAYLYGSEIGFHLHPHPWDWLHWESNFEFVIGKSKTGAYLPLIPAPKFTNTVRVNSIRFPSFFISMKNIFDQRNVSDYELASKGYTLLDAGLDYSFDVNRTNITLGMSGTNILNKKYIAHLSRFKEEGFLNPGRSFVLRMNIRL